MTREALKKLNEKQMNYCKTLSALIDRAKIKGLKEENERNRGKLRGYGTSSHAARPYMTVANEKAHEKVVEAQRSIWESETGE